MKDLNDLHEIDFIVIRPAAAHGEVVDKKPFGRRWRLGGKPAPMAARPAFLQTTTVHFFFLLGVQGWRKMLIPC